MVSSVTLLAATLVIGIAGGFFMFTADVIVPMLLPIFFAKQKYVYRPRSQSTVIMNFVVWITIVSLMFAILNRHGISWSIIAELAALGVVVGIVILAVVIGPQLRRIKLAATNEAGRDKRP